MTSASRIYLVNNVSDPKVRPITDMPSKYNVPGSLFLKSLCTRKCRCADTIILQDSYATCHLRSQLYT